MYWLGDSKWGWKFNFRRFPGEFIQGLVDNIPPCCVIYYTLVKAVCLLVHGPYNSLSDPLLGLPHKPSKRCKDSMIFSMFYDLKRQKNGKLRSEDSHKLDYWRCPLCRLINRGNKLDWTTKSKWDYKTFW